MNAPFPRPLTQREAAILDFLLSGDFPGVEALRRQAGVADVSGSWADCCASIELYVDHSRADPASVREPIPVEARSRDREPPYELLLFVEDGWLKTLEIVHYADGPGPAEFPPPDAFHPPWWDEPSYRKAHSPRT